MAIPDSAKELVRVDKFALVIYLLQSGKFSLRILDRQYRHAELDQLVAIALAEEKDPELRAAIREAIYAAQDVIDAEATT